MSQDSKYATLPDLDSAPDIYETPGLDEDSTRDDLSSRSASPGLDLATTASASGVSRQQLRPTFARTQFSSARVVAREVDFSDRIDSKRKSYRTSNGPRTGKNGIVERYSNSSEEEDEELDRKLVRLRREIEEVRLEVEGNTSHATSGDSAQYGGAVSLDDIIGLANTLRAVQASRDTTVKPNAAARARANELRVEEVVHGASNDMDVFEGPGAVQNYDDRVADSRDAQNILAKAAEFDTRLAILEKALGVASLEMQKITSSSAMGILPTLEILERQMSSISNASISSLETMNRQIHQLIMDAERLEDTRSAANAAQEAAKAKMQSTSAKFDAIHSSSLDSGPRIEDMEIIAKLNTLYSVLPKIEALSPLLPAVLDRLRSLKLLHTDAGVASDNLSHLEKKQAFSTEEIKKWREGLERVEKAMEGGQGAVQGNVAVVESWMKDIEARMQKLG